MLSRIGTCSPTPVLPTLGKEVVFRDVSGWQSKGVFSGTILPSIVLIQSTVLVLMVNSQRYNVTDNSVYTLVYADAIWYGMPTIGFRQLPFTPFR